MERKLDLLRQIYIKIFGGNYMKKTLLIVLVLTLCAFLFACTNAANEPQPKEDVTKQLEKQQNDGSKDDSIIYENPDYGFSFSLPEGWKNYTIETEEWKGLALDGTQSDKVVENGLIIKIRHPQWTSENQRQDIPIMIFTTAQWGGLQEGKFHIGAAPIGPIELGRNNEYVFALPARYNFAFPTGYEEVEQILKYNPLQPIK